MTRIRRFTFRKRTNPAAAGYSNARIILGTRTNGLKPGEYIDEFIIGRPNNYAYRFVKRWDVTKQPKTDRKFRGITPNYTASQLVNLIYLSTAIG